MPDVPASNVSSDAGLETSAEPAPAFARFPWIQLVFCVACLSMVAWTWMRFSYAHNITTSALETTELSTEPVEPISFLLTQKEDGSEEKVFILPNISLIGHYVELHADGSGSLPATAMIKMESSPGFVHTTQLRRGTLTKGRVIWIRFNPPVNPCWGDSPYGKPCLGINTLASRFHGASIAGLVIGVMGCFIFGLYLRSWLRERKALACEPPQDMIV
jgi:hypothetical protein